MTVKLILPLLPIKRNRSNSEVNSTCQQWAGASQRLEGALFFRGEFAMRVRQLIAGLMCLCILSPLAGAAVFSFADGTRAGQVEFDVIGKDLVVTLTNTSTFNTTVPEELLTAVFFDLSG